MQIERERRQDIEAQLERRDIPRIAANQQSESRVEMEHQLQWITQLQDARSQYAELNRAAQVEYRETVTRADLVSR